MKIYFYNNRIPRNIVTFKTCCSGLLFCQMMKNSLMPTKTTILQFFKRDMLQEFKYDAINDI